MRKNIQENLIKRCFYATLRSKRGFDRLHKIYSYRQRRRLNSLGISGGAKITVLHADKKNGCVVAAGGDPIGLSRGVCERTEVE